MNINYPSKRRRIQEEGVDTNSEQDDKNNNYQQPSITTSCDIQEEQQNHRYLYTLIESKEWSEVAVRAKQNPIEVSACTKEPSMLALCCRLGAPYYCVKEIIDASPAKLRHLVDARGTPLHEAIVCHEIGPKVIEYLLHVDEYLVKATTDLEDSDSCQQQQRLRATIMQDVDGYTPLHLLIRRRFQSHVLAADNIHNYNNGLQNNNNNNNHNMDDETTSTGSCNSRSSSHFIEILELLVNSCPEATIIPDRGEYEEPPIVMAIKANVYAPMLPQTQQAADNNNINNNGAAEAGGENATAPVVRIERHIYDMVNCMLQHYPDAAGRVFNGYRGQYTALHSAVFHGRCSSTIELILNAERRSTQLLRNNIKSQQQQQQKACLLGNTQGELPLHFCTMRGEPPWTVALLAKAAPEAILQRDTSGLTPVHWLWIRFVSTLLAIEDGRGSSVTVPLRRISTQQQQNFTFSSLEQDNFDADLQLLRKIDPTVDFLRMRHIPTEVQDGSDALQWAEHTANILKGVRDRFELATATGGGSAETNSNEEDERKRRREGRVNQDDNNHNDQVVILTRIEAVTTLFWIKVVSLLKAISISNGDGSYDGDLSLVRTAFESECCPPLVARIVALLFPPEVSRPDTNGRLALHYAAMRPWHAWEWPREDGTSDNVASSKLLNLESASLLRNAMSLSSVEVAKHRDNHGCLPIHYMISTCIQACCATGRSCSVDPLVEMLEIIGYFLKLNPSSLNVCDPRNQLLPFLQASAESAAHVMMNNNNNNNPLSIHEEFPLSIVYLLLRQDPSLVQPALL